MITLRGEFKGFTQKTVRKGQMDMTKLMVRILVEEPPVQHELRLLDENDLLVQYVNPALDVPAFEIFGVATPKPSDSTQALVSPEHIQPVTITFEHAEMEFKPEHVYALSQMTHLPTATLRIQVTPRNVQTSFAVDVIGGLAP